MMTGTLVRIFRSRMMESPSSSGMFRSSTTRAGTLVSIAPRRLLPPSHSVTVKPCILRYSPTISRAGASSSTMMMCGLWVMSRHIRRGQYYREGRSLSRPGAVGRHLAAMHVNDTLDDRKPETGRAFAGGGFRREPLEGAKQSSEIFRRQAGAFIGDADHGLVLLAVDQHRNLAADRTVFDGVADQIVDRLPHPVGIAHGHEVRRRRHRDSLLLVGGQRLIGIGDFGDQGGDIDRLPANRKIEGAGPGVGK